MSLFDQPKCEVNIFGFVFPSKKQQTQETPRSFILHKLPITKTHQNHKLNANLAKQW